MAHDLNYNSTTGKHSFFSTRQKAWHGLGQIVHDYPTSAEAIQFAGLDYEVQKRTIFTHRGDEVINDIAVNNYFATIRTDTDQVLGVVGNDYEVVQNVDAFNFFDSIVGGRHGIKYETAGALGSGERIFITAKLPEFIQVGRDDLIERYLFLTTSHDGTGSIMAAFTPVRVVCANTLAVALKNNDRCIRIRHTQNAQERLKEAHKLMGITNAMSNELHHIFNRWAHVRITDAEVKKLVAVAMAPNKEVLNNVLTGKDEELSSRFNNVLQSVTNYAFSHPTQITATTEGTLFGAYNAITGYYQNVKTYKDGESKLKNIVFGSGLQKSLSAFNLCGEFEKQGVRALQLN
jgi:phage/plasmid-like protein (TIGR03299 family)